MAQYYSSNRMTSFLDGVIEFLEEAVVKKLFYVSQNACIDELRIAEDFKGDVVNRISANFLLPEGF